MQDITSLKDAFKNQATCNPDINGWNVSRVTSLYGTFMKAAAFNSPLNFWDVSAVTNMDQTFSSAFAFNQDISMWDTSRVTDMGWSFFSTTAFDQDLGLWNVGSVNRFAGMFNKAGLSDCNKKLIGESWAAQSKPYSDWATAYSAISCTQVPLLSATSTAATTTSMSATTTEAATKAMVTTTLMASTAAPTPSISTTEQGSAAFNPEPIAEAVAAVEAAVVRNISSGEKVVITTQGASIVAQRVSQADVAGDSVTVSGGEQATVAITVPASLIDELGGDVVVLLTAFQADLEQSQTEQRRKAKGGVTKVEGMVSIKMMKPSSAVAAHIHGLEVPIVLTLPVNVSQGAECAYWDEDRSEWSAEGLETMKDRDGGPLRCSTTHLTIFGAIWRGIVKAVKCSNADMLSQEGLEAVVQTTWYLDRGPQVLGGMTVLMLLLTIVSLCLERHRFRKGHRDDAIFFMVVMPDEAEVVEEAASRMVTGSCVCEWLWACFDPLWQELVAGFGDIWATVKDLIMEVRGLCLEHDAAARGDTPFLTYMTFRLLEHAVVSSVLLETAAQLGLGQDDVTHFIDRHKEKAAEDAPGNQNEEQEDEEVQKSVDMTTKHGMIKDVLDNPEVSQLSKPDTAAEQPQLKRELTSRHLQRMEFVEQLSKKVLLAVRRNFDDAGSCCRHPLLFWRLFLMKNPWLSALHFSIFMPSSMSVFILLVLLAGTSAIAALFFTASGGVRVSRRAQLIGNCEMADAWESFGQLLLISALTALVANVPTAMLGACHARDFMEHFEEESKEWQMQLRRWRFRDWFIWSLGIVLFIFYLFFCVVFLANVSEQDTDEWMISVLISVGMQAFAMPLFSASLLSSLAWMGLQSARIRGQCESQLCLKHLDIGPSSDCDVKEVLVEDSDDAVIETRI